MGRASAAIVAVDEPGDAPRIATRNSIWCSGSMLSLRGVVVSSQVICDSKGRAELAGCTLEGDEGLMVRDGATVDVQGGKIYPRGGTGVRCCDSGSRVTVRPPTRAGTAAARAKCRADCWRFLLACHHRLPTPFGSPEPPRTEG